MHRRFVRISALICQSAVMAALTLNAASSTAQDETGKAGADRRHADSCRTIQFRFAGFDRRVQPGADPARTAPGQFVGDRGPRARRRREHAPELRAGPADLDSRFRCALHFRHPRRAALLGRRAADDAGRQGQAANVDLSSAQRVEVMRGPFSALYGNSSGGVISVFTEDGPEDFAVMGSAWAGALVPIGSASKSAAQGWRTTYSTSSVSIRTASAITARRRETRSTARCAGHRRPLRT